MVSILAEARDFPLLQNTQTSSGAQPASYSMCIWSFFVGVEWPAHQVEHSPPTKVEVKNEWNNTSLSLIFLPQGQLYLL
jgi:hypothetical protein